MAVTKIRKRTVRKKMKKTVGLIIGLILACMMLMLTLAGCGTTTADSYGGNSTALSNSPGSPSESQQQSTSPSNSQQPSSNSPASQQSSPDANGANNSPITVISREDGSGTRGAFTELFGVIDENKVDQTTLMAEITNSTSVMMTSVAGDPNAIGYISLGSLNNTVKAARIDGVEATVDNINNGSYTISRPFNIAVKTGISSVAQDFIDYIMSVDGQDIIEANGYIRVDDTGAYNGAKPSGKVIIGGSSSVSPVMEKLIEAYLSVNTGADIELQTSDSSTGMNNTIDGVCNIGMASRELKASEHDAGLEDITIAMDGIAVIVNNGNTADVLTKEQVKQIFLGEITNWSEIG